MCAIFGSFNRNKFSKLAEVNGYRGSHSYSISIYDPIKKEIKLIKRDLGKFSMDTVDNYMGVYWIGHIQAPTTDDKDLDSVHPSQEDFSWLWHNGIIKDNYVKEMQKEYGDIKWDTRLLNLRLNDNKSLDEVDGAFSCLRYENGNMYLFRNEISPMFIDKELSISSTSFTGARKTTANAVLKLNFDDYNYSVVQKFTTKENPYYFG